MTAAWMTPALIGVSRAPTPPVAGDVGEGVAQLVAGIDDPALAFSRMAGALAACRLAAVAFDERTTLPPPADADASMLPASHPYASALAFALQCTSTRLQYETFLQLARAGAHLPAASLPAALDAGRRHAALRAPLLPVLGARGYWLAALNPDWAYARGVSADDAADVRLWDQGTLDQRVAFFQALRTRDRAAAHALLAPVLPAASAKERIAFVEALEPGLGSDDEELLAPLLNDRSRDVRAVAARLLASLPGSAHARRMEAWLEPLVTRKRALLRMVFECEAPASADPNWARAGIEPRRPQYEQLGERAWWLYQLVRQVRLDWWTAHTAMSPVELVRWAGKSEWAGALYRGWRERVGPGDADWLDALLESPAASAHARAALLSQLPAERRERHWADSVDALAQAGQLGDVVQACTLGATLSAPFSRALVASLPAVLAGERLRQDYGVRAFLLDLACAVHPDALAAWPAAPRTEGETPALAECLTELERRVHARRILHGLA